MLPRQRFAFARGAYVGIVLIATMSGLALGGDMSEIGSRLARAFSPGVGWRDVVDGLRNVALFAGLGVVWVVTSVSGDVGRAVREAAFAGLALSAMIEAVQLFSPVRSASIIDVGTNSLGAVAGAVAVALLSLAVRRAKGGRSYLGLPSFIAAAGYGAAVLCEALTPLFRPTVFQQYQGSPRDTLQFALQLALPLQLSQVPWTDLLLFAPAGFLAVLWLNESGGATPRRLGLLAAGTAAGAFACEYVHGLYGLAIRWEAAVLHVIAIALGAWLAMRYLAPLSKTLRGAARARAAVFCWLLLLVVWGWRPFIPRVSDFGNQFELTQIIPLASLAMRMDVFSALHVVQQFALYLPLGSLLAVWPLRTAGRWSHLWPAVLIACVIELGHIVVAQRLFDVTNALVALSGLGVGWIVLRRSGFTPYGAALPVR